MLVYVYDKSFEGLLTAVFDLYYRKEHPDELIGADEPEPMFTESVHNVVTDNGKSSRVWSGLEKKVDRYVLGMLVCLWLSEERGSDTLLFRYIRKIFDSPAGAVFNFADDDILRVKKTAQKVNMEKMRLMQFVRFQKASDGTYFAPVAPVHNALPLAIDHFKDRFSDQKWIIYDTKRHYGFAYDLEKVVEITLDNDEDLIEGKLADGMLAKDEELFQQMWKGYFKALTIKERINRRQQRQYMPVRYWKYMTEHQE